MEAPSPLAADRRPGASVTATADCSAPRRAIPGCFSPAGWSGLGAGRQSVDDAIAESACKTRKLEERLAHETFEEVYNALRLRSALGHLSPVQCEKQHTRLATKIAA